MKKNSPMIVWENDEIRALKVLWKQGFTEKDIAEKLSRSVYAVSHEIIKIRKSGDLPERKENNYDWLVEEFVDIPTHKDEALKINSNRIMVWGDSHLPYLNLELAKHMFEIAKIWKIPDCLIAGDFFNQDAFSFFDGRYKYSWEKEKQKARVFMNHLLLQFNKVYVILGNHDLRILRMLKFQETFKSLMLGITISQRVIVTEYPRAEINDDWLCVHPKSYSQISGRVAQKLAGKYHKNFICPHGHFTSYSFDISGDYQCIDIGGLMDYDKTEYVNFSITTHPRWVGGFLVLDKSYPYIFHEKTNWDFWKKALK